ncbi:NinG protein [Echinicola strongylocentroti]|uniref:NinG protein n=1 Tax=Echinicola strongylocentroti TaxID=1795355 RepID=A0A2Z4IN36_9BACT|nr:recombination protein NinG [Echinicola strongylocentroti]AWW32150.1 NinG protein [Echinicola strongylocentroti]
MESLYRQKYQDKKLSWLLEKAQEAFNRYIRKRDNNNPRKGFFTCISCGKVRDEKYLQAGHYMPAGSNAPVRFDEMNVHGQCVECNTYLHGNQEAYRRGLVRKYGEEAVEDLELKAKQMWKWSRPEIIAIITDYRAKVKEVNYD